MKVPPDSREAVAGERQGVVRALTSHPIVFTALQTMVSRGYKPFKDRLALGFLVPGLRYLDVGCGTGNLYPFIRQHDCEYVGIDVDPQAIDFARRRFPGGDFRVGDARSRADLDHACDRAFSIGILHHLTDEEAATVVGGIAALLKPGGRYLVIDAAPALSSLNIVGKLMRRLDTGAHIRPASWYRDILNTHFHVVAEDEFSQFPLDYFSFELERS